MFDPANTGYYDSKVSEPIHTITVKKTKFDGKTKDSEGCWQCVNTEWK